MISEANARSLFIVTDIKQHAHCPRITYYERCLSHVRPRTYKMDVGVLEHEEEQGRAKRRSLNAYQVLEGERLFDVSLVSERYSLSGTIDEVVRTANHEVIPIDYKGSSSIRTIHRLQLTAYALLIEDVWNIPISHGFIYLIPKRKALRVAITAPLRQQVQEALIYMRQIVEHEEMPPPMPMEKRAVCVGCEFRRFCNDVI